MATNVENGNGFRPERGGVRNLAAAYRHIREARHSGDVKQRLFDHVSLAVVAVGTVALVAVVLIDVTPVVKIATLATAFAVVLAHTLHRVGIFLSVTPRQALLFWQLLLGGFWLGITLGLLVMALSVVVVAP